MNKEKKVASKNEEFIQQIKNKNKNKNNQEYKMWSIEDINVYREHQEYYYSIR